MNNNFTKTKTKTEFLVPGAVPDLKMANVFTLHALYE